jgi:hypothetical protein
MFTAGLLQHDIIIIVVSPFRVRRRYVLFRRFILSPGAKNVSVFDRFLKLLLLLLLIRLLLLLYCSFGV